MLISLYR